MKKYLIIMATLALLLLVFAPAAFAQDEGWAGDAGGYGGGYGGGGYGGYGGGYGWNNCQGGCYMVRYGDTLFSIGRMFNVNPWHIAQVNQLPNPNCIYAGQMLYIPPTDGHPYPWQAHYRPHPMPPIGWPQPMPPVSGPHPIPPMYPGYPHPEPYGQSDSYNNDGGYGYESNDGYAYGAPEQGYGNY